MNMKTRALLKPATLMVIAMTSCLWGQAEKSPVQKGAVPQKELLEYVSGLNSVLASLAAERYAINCEKREIWVFTIHQGSQIRKYSDKTYTVVSLPVVQEGHRGAFCQYASAYNGFNLRACESFVR